MSGSDFHFQGRHPSTRPRRLRQKAWIRDLVAEHALKKSDLVWPIFLTENKEAESIQSMPEINRHPISDLPKIAEQALSLGLRALALFPFTPLEKRDETGSLALNGDNLVCRAIQSIKRSQLEIGVICDVALDPYTSHGHDGLLRDGEILNDESVDMLVKQALVLAQSGCDIIAPSDMMDGRIGAIRHHLDGQNYQNVMILSYAVKYASALYGPFRDAVGAKGVLEGDKRSYQMAIANSDEALREVALDIQQGADMIMVKPAGFYADIINRVKNHFAVPIFAYQVSGEYMMISAGARQGDMKREDLILESLLSLKRAGADTILTYFAPEIAARL